MVNSIWRKARYFILLLAQLKPIVAYFIQWKEIVLPPSTLDIEPNNNCNFKCPHCQVSHWNKKIALLTVDSFRAIIDQVPTLVSIKLQGMGEPLLNKDLFGMLQLGEARGIEMRFTSNGSLCDNQKNERLAELKNTIITFSVDGATKETFEKIRIGSDFEKVKRNIRDLVKRRGNKKRPILRGWSVITKDNIRELPEMVGLAKELGVDRIIFQPFLSNWGKKSMEEHINRVEIDRMSKAFERQLDEAKKEAKRQGIPIEVCYDNVVSKQKKCSWPWRSAYITSSGDVIPCCSLGDADIITMGNVFEENFYDIWYSKKYHDFRQSIKDHDVPGFCKRCYVEP